MGKDPTKPDFGPKKRLTKTQSIITMIAGGLLLVIPWFFPTGQDSAVSTVKTVVSVMGFVVLCLGSYFQP